MSKSLASWRSCNCSEGSPEVVLLLVGALWLPESPRFLVGRANLTPRHRALLVSLSIAPGPTEPHAVDIARENPVKMLFGKGHALQTGLLWIIFFGAIRLEC